MSADSELRHGWQEWRRLMEAEECAIRAGRWPLVADCQGALRRLQPRLARQTADARREWRALGLDSTAKEDELNATIRALLELARQNDGQIRSRRRRVAEQLAKLEQAGQMLRRLQHRYTPPRRPGWTSLS